MTNSELYETIKYLAEVAQRKENLRTALSYDAYSDILKNTESKEDSKND